MSTDTKPPRSSGPEGTLAPIDRHFAALMGRLSGGVPEVRLAAALVSYHCRQGHICVDLEALDAKALPPESLAELGLSSWPNTSAFLDKLRSSPVVGRPGDFTPLVLDEGGRLYLHRYWKYETTLAQNIARLAAEPAPAMDKDRLQHSLAALFPQQPLHEPDRAAQAPHPFPLPIRWGEGGRRPGEGLVHGPVAGQTVVGATHETNWQLVAAFAATRRRFCIISGGPGTGKTRTAVVLLSLLLEQHPSMRIALAAPTGKAAARLQETVKAARATLPCSANIKDRLPAEASTLHRLLGYIPDSAFFRHDADNPLPYDTIVVDEASMVDLALMAKLVAAVSRSARLILLGDKDQLASVEAGAVLADLCDGGQAHSFSDAFITEFKAATGQQLPAEKGRAPSSDLSDCIVELRKNYRFGEQSAIFQLSRAVNEGNADKAVALLGSTNASLEDGGLKQGATPSSILHPASSCASPVASHSFAWRPVPQPAALKDALRPLVLAGYRACLQASNPTEALSAFAEFRILCALRNGPYGVQNLNRLVEAILAEAGLIAADAPFYAGQPVMVVRNDYNLKLFNGDVGIVRLNENKELRACFAGPDQTVRDFMPLRLPEHETAYAMTVHKSQGSEFERVLLILPGEDSPVLSRELVYTGLTRASKHVELWTDPAIFKTAIQRKISRRSGLREALWSKGSAASP